MKGIIMKKEKEIIKNGKNNLEKLENLMSKKYKNK